MVLLLVGLIRQPREACLTVIQVKPLSTFTQYYGHGLSSCFQQMQVQGAGGGDPGHILNKGLLTGECNLIHTMS